MDLRVLAAVFVTLFAIGIGMSQGDLQSRDIFGTLKGFDGTDLSDLLQQKAERQANNSISARLENRAAVQLELGTPTSMSITLDPDTRVRTGDSTLTTSEPSRITFQRFTGSVTITGRNVSVDGTARDIAVGSFTFNYSSPKVVRITDGHASAYSFTGIRGQRFVFRNTSGTVTPPFESKTGFETVRFESFRGNLTVPQPNTYEFEGRVFRAMVRSGNTETVIGGDN